MSERKDLIYLSDCNVCKNRSRRKRTSLNGDGYHQEFPIRVIIANWTPDYARTTVAARNVRRSKGELRVSRAP